MEETKKIAEMQLLYKIKVNTGMVLGIPSDDRNTLELWYFHENNGQAIYLESFDLGAENKSAQQVMDDLANGDYLPTFVKRVEEEEVETFSILE